MAMTVLMKQTRQGDAGAVLSAGSTYTVTEKLGAELVGVGFATDVTSALQTGRGVQVMAEINGVTGGIEFNGINFHQPTDVTVTTLGDSLMAYNNNFGTPTAAVRSGGVVTMTATGHALADQSLVRIFGFSDSSFNSEYTRITRVDANTFTYSSAGSDGSATMSATFNRYLCFSWYSNVSPFMFANAVLGGPLKLVANLGQSGETSDLIAARVSSVLMYKPAECWVLGGTNDVVSSMTAAQTKTNLKTIYDYLRQKGIFVRAITIPPLGSGHASFATATPKIHQINHWIRQYCRSKTGIACADVFSAIVDPASATGAPRTSALQSDNIHWQTYGGYLAGQKIAASYNGQLPTVDVLTKSQADSYSSNAANPNIWGGAPWAATGGTISDVVTGVAGDGFNIASAGNAGRVATASVPARSDGYGYDQQVVFTSAAASDTVTIQQESAAILAGRVIAGEQYTLSFNLSITGVSGSGLSYFRSRLQGAFGGTTVALGSASHSLVAGSNNVNTDLVNLVITTPPFTIPSGACTSLTHEWICAFTSAGTALTLKVGRVSMDRVDTDSQ